MGSSAGEQAEAFREFELMEGLDHAPYALAPADALAEPGRTTEGTLSGARPAGFKRVVQTERLESASKSLFATLQNDLGEVIPWFFEQMPPLYDVLTTEEEKHDHIL